MVDCNTFFTRYNSNYSVLLIAKAAYTNPLSSKEIKTGEL
ncbi:MAG: hypothetical protein ACI9AV_002084 [Sediminicola sp.]|jgi:hypothetical protein